MTSGQRLMKFLGFEIRTSEIFEPASFRDPLALSIEWGALTDGGTTFCTHTLCSPHSHRVEFQPKLGAKGFYGTFILIGVIAMCVLPYRLITMATFEPQFLFMFFIGICFAGLGTYFWKSGTTPIVFDRGEGRYWKSRKTPKHVAHPEEIEAQTPLHSIHAIQLVSELCKGHGKSFMCYELNLILHNGERLHVVGHGDKQQLIRDGNTLARFLNIPLWNAF